MFGSGSLAALDSAMNVHDLKARIGTARILLTDLAGKHAHSAASRTQAAALIASTKKAFSAKTPPAETLADLQALALQVPWATEDQEDVLAVLQATGKKAPRRGLQNFCTVHEFLSEREWESLKGNLAAQTETLMRRVFSLGGRCLTEETYKHLTAIIVNMGANAAHVRSMLSSQKDSLNLHVKHEWDMLRRRHTAQPAEYLLVLPASPDLLRAQHPRLFDEAYPDEGPVECPIDAQALVAFTQSFKCRGGSTLRMQSLQLALPSTSAGCAESSQMQGMALVGPLQQFANCMMQGMAQMQTTQNRIIGALASSGSDGRALQLDTWQMENCQGLQPVQLKTPPRRGQTLRSVSSASLLEEPMTPSAPAAMASAPAAIEDAASGEKEEDNQERGTIALLNMMDQREHEKAQAAKEAKAAKAALKAAEKRPAEEGGADTAAHVKKKAKAAAKLTEPAAEETAAVVVAAAAGKKKK